ncbi:Na+/H+ antiporter [Legionella hackeliae]|uniref:Putative cation/proton antiporter n=1 Tax=Legionella hackeliae TaxID=449 RepID=A0A0A8UR40_LEGHA|nr:Na+/H+ antiporter [Legionella hackeliae]KTD15447.1 cation/proton antiporter [Legionella hackeliae]CEK11183.1 putative cation/proton antiporter [Legionella hackeliae]STX47949.1 cation/proton antiporter [Legionella hackeliae]
MENALICLTFLFLLVIAEMIRRLIPSLPAPLIQISIGALIGFFFPGSQVEFNPELFMLLFIPPLLFIDSWRFPKREFLSNTRPIIMLSIGLVFFTVIGMGYFIHWLIPLIPLPASFALAAALSPTDAVALRSLAANAPIPERILHILQGEALLNDASGLVSFKFAVTAMLTGVFSFTNVGFSLLLIGLGGLAIGALMTYLFIILLGRLNIGHPQETAAENLLIILLPFTAYLVAEKFEVSGILAAVAAGFTIDNAGFLDRTLATMRIEGHFVRGMIETILNGAIFILLGIYIANSYDLLSHTGSSFPHCAFIVFVLTFSIIALRFAWIYLTLPFEALIARHRHKAWHRPHLRVIAVISLGGVRGAIALAAILSLPTLMPDGAPFPEHDLLITIAVGVILCSLLVSMVILPLLLPGLKELIKNSPNDEEKEAIVSAVDAGIKAIEKKMDKLCETMNESEADICKQVGNTILATLNQFLASNIAVEAESDSNKLALEIELELRLAGLEGARQELRALRKSGKINNTTMMSLIGRLDLRQISLVNSNRTGNKTSKI